MRDALATLAFQHLQRGERLEAADALNSAPTRQQWPTFLRRNADTVVIQKCLTDWGAEMGDASQVSIPAALRRELARQSCELDPQLGTWEFVEEIEISIDGNITRNGDGRRHSTQHSEEGDVILTSWRPPASALRAISAVRALQFDDVALVYMELRKVERMRASYAAEGQLYYIQCIL